MNQLKIEELSAYLPYNVQVKEEYLCVIYNETVIENYTLDIENLGFIFGNKNSKLLLRPLSQLTTEIEVNGEKFVPIDRISELGLGHVDYISNEREYWIKTKTHTGWLNSIHYVIIQKLLSWHFDIFGLIDRNLAEPIV